MPNPDYVVRIELHARHEKNPETSELRGSCVLAVNHVQRGRADSVADEQRLGEVAADTKDE